MAILLVDDSSDSRLLLSEILAQEGFGATLECDCAEAALALLDGPRRAEVDLVLMDVQMPGLDGVAACSRITSREDLHHIPVVMVTGSKEPAVLEAAFAAGATDYIAKPYLSVELAARVRAAVALKHERDRRRAREAELARSEETLRTQATLLRSILDGMGEAVLVTNERGSILLANPAASAFGKLAICPPPDETSSTHSFANTDGSPLPPERLPVCRALAGENVDSFEFVVRERATGVERCVSATARPLRNQDGSPRGSVVVFRDVTEHRRMQAQLLVADRMASVGMLAAGVAHEINNPLAYVTANTDLAVGTLPELLQQALAAPPDDSATRAALTERFADLARALEESRQGAERVRAIVRDLSTFARGEDTRNGPVDLRRIVESTLNVASNELRHRARLVRDIDDVDPVDGREGGLGQVVLNLLFHVMHRLSEGAADRNVITVRLKRGADGTTVLELSDNGPAIPPDRLGHLFDPYRVSADGHGSGLGLAVCHATVLALGGSITAANGTDRGCVFRIVLPRSREPLPPPPPSAVKPPVPGKRGRLLIIDDEPMIGASLKRALGREYDVTATTSATDALAALDRGERWDVILCDLMMPTMSGMDLYEALQTRLPDQVERIVFLTGGAFTPRGQRFLAEVPNPRIEKPFDVKNLRDIVRERMG